MIYYISKFKFIELINLHLTDLQVLELVLENFVYPWYRYGCFKCKSCFFLNVLAGKIKAKFNITFFSFMICYQRYYRWWGVCGWTETNNPFLCCSSGSPCTKSTYTFTQSIETDITIYIHLWSGILTKNGLVGGCALGCDGQNDESSYEAHWDHGKSTTERCVLWWNNWIL